MTTSKPPGRVSRYKILKMFEFTDKARSHGRLGGLNSFVYNTLTSMLAQEAKTIYKEKEAFQNRCQWFVDLFATGAWALRLRASAGDGCDQFGSRENKQAKIQSFPIE